jgi:hypothetical protein
MQSVTHIQSDRQQPVTGRLSSGGLSTGLIGEALRRAESVLMGGGQQTARQNAWDAVCENRRLAQDREDFAPPRLRATR